MMNLLR